MKIFSQRNCALGSAFMQFIFRKNPWHFALRSIIPSILFCLVWNVGSGQVSISAGNTVGESFSIGTDRFASLPTGWKVNNINTVRTLGPIGTYAVADSNTNKSGGNLLSALATNGIYNFGAGDAAIATDRAVGGLSSSFGSKSVNEFVELNNVGATNINYFTINYDVEKYRDGKNPAGFSIQMYYSTNDTTWTSAGPQFLTSFNADMDDNGYASAPGATVYISNRPLAVSLPAGANLYLAWNYSVTSGNSTKDAQALGIDDVSITAAPAGAASVPSDYFRSKNSGDWSSVNTWESSSDGSIWSNATQIPTSAANTITIQSGNTVSVSTSVSLDQTIIAGTLELQTGGVLNINDGTGDDILIPANGILRVTSTDNYTAGVNQSNGADINIATNGKITIGNGSASIGANFENFATSTSTPNVWNTGAIYEYNSNTTFAASNLTYFPNAGTNIPIFRVTNVSGTPGAPSKTDINGLLEVNSSFAFTGNGLKTFRDGITGTATLTLPLSPQGYTISSASAILGGTLNLVLLNENLHLTNGVTVPLGANVTVTQSGGKGFLKAGGSFKVDGIIDISDVTISNTNGGDVTVNGTLKTSKSNGLYNPGNIASGTININAGSTIEYNGTLNQSVTSTATLNQSYYNITFSGSGTKTPNGAISVNTLGTVKITGASVIVNATSSNLGLTTTNTTNFTMDGGRLILGTGGTQPNMDGTYNLTGGVVEFTGGSVKTIRSKPYQNVEVTGSSVGNSNGNIILNDGGSFTIKSTGIFSINDNSITGVTSTPSVTVENGGVFKCGNNQGFNGYKITYFPTLSSSINSNITNVTLQPGSTVEYTKAGDQPITNANGLVYQNLTLSGSGIKTAPAGVLTINGNLSKTTGSVFAHNNGTVVFNGSVPQFYSSITPQMVFNNLTNNNTNGLSVNDSLSVYKELLLGAYSKITLNADITLKSDNANTANVAPMPANATITYNEGRFIVERYIPNHFKAWQFLAVPTKGSTVRESWQEGNVPGGNEKPGYGAQITSNLPNATSLGFDLSSFSPSMKTYDPAADSWVGIPNTSMNIENSHGYMLFVRGDRSVTAANQPANATILRTLGKLYSPGSEAPQTISIPANSFQSIGNPYASAIDFSNLNFTGGVEDAYYIWDPQLTSGTSSAYGYGGYRTISGNTVVPSGGNYIDGNPPPIQSGQAFFVYGTSGGTISFSENSKVTGSASIFRPMNEFVEPSAQLRVNLYAVNNSETILIDGIITQFDKSYSNALDTWDAIKNSNSGENIGIVSNGKELAIERRQMAHINDTLFYNLQKLKQQSYQFEFIGTHLDQYGMEALLEDNYLHTKTPLNLTGTTLTNFTVDNTVASRASGSGRFQVVFSPSAGPLPVTFSLVNAYQQNADIVIEWKVETENNMSHYEVEKSASGNSFISAGTQDARNMPGSNYQWIDANPFDGYNYYRIKSIGINGDIKYSQVVRVYMGKGKTSISVYPNPVTGGIINLQLINQPAGNYKVRLLNSLGQVIAAKEINHRGGSSSQSVSFNKYTLQGIYHLEVVNPVGEKNVIQIKN
ncbi:MAG TPA: T9SS type A sorting domain-containing protein [Hanamia sp.]